MPIITGVAHLAIIGTVTTTTGVQRKVCNSFTYHVVDRTLPDKLAADWEGAVNGGFWGTVANALSVEYRGVEISVLFPEVAGDTWQKVGVPSSGARPGPRRPLFHAAYFWLRCKERGRHYRGGKHFGPIAVSDATGDQISSAGNVVWGPVSAALQQSLIVSLAHEPYIFLPFVWSRFLTGEDPTVDPVIGGTLVAATLSPVVAHWRHRKEHSNLTS